MVRIQVVSRSVPLKLLAPLPLPPRPPFSTNFGQSAQTLYSLLPFLLFLLLLQQLALAAAALPWHSTISTISTISTTRGAEKKRVLLCDARAPSIPSIPIVVCHHISYCISYILTSVRPMRAHDPYHAHESEFGTIIAILNSIPSVRVGSGLESFGNLIKILSFRVCIRVMSVDQVNLIKLSK